MSEPNLLKLDTMSHHFRSRSQVSEKLKTELFFLQSSVLILMKFCILWQHVGHMNFISVFFNWARIAQLMVCWTLYSIVMQLCKFNPPWSHPVDGNFLVELT